MTAPAPDGGSRRRIVVAPDSFKGTLRAVDVARAIADGWRSVHPADEVVVVPMADGGEGTLDAFEAAAAGAERVPVTVAGPLGALHDSAWLRVPPSRDGDSGFAVVELACTAGIELIPDEGSLRPLDASSRGFGEAVRAAIEAGAERLVLAIGSSASSDGGAGLLQALGARALDAEGQPIAPGARGVATTVELDLSGLVVPPAGGVVVLTDVVSPLLGSDGAASVFGPQKGATAADVRRIDEALAAWARHVDVDPATPGAGAAGGAGFALIAWGAHLTPGAQAVAELLDLDDTVRGAALVVTGEGRYDSQSDRGKAPSIVLAAAARAGVPAAVVAGSVSAQPQGVAAAVSLTELGGSREAAMAATGHWLREAGARLARDLGGAG